MNILFYACFLIGLCQGDFDLELNKNLNFQSHIEFNKNYVNNLEIKDPPKTWIKLLTTPDICLFYKTPYKTDQGVLKITKVKNMKCDEITETNFMKDKIDKLRVSYSKNKFEINFYINENKSSVGLFGYKEKVKYKKYSSNVESYKVENITLNEVLPKNVLTQGQLCHGVNSNCTSIVENTCDTCEEGFHEVVDYNCPQGGSKYCGKIECGQKNLPACPRGYEVLNTKLSSLCFDGSPAGNCAPGLKTFCNDDKILICI